LEAGTNPDQKEGYYVGEEITKSHPYFVGKKLNSGPNQWPEGFSRADLFRKSSLEYYDHMHALARDVLNVVAQTLYLDANYFGDFTKGAVATLRYLHYPPQLKDSDEKLSRGIGAHTDFGSVTLLMQDEVDGLQVWEKATEEWLDVRSTLGAVNAFSCSHLSGCSDQGSVRCQSWQHVHEMVSLPQCYRRGRHIDTRVYRSNDRYISNLHRVINKSGLERYSVPFFYSGNPDYQIDCLPNCREEGTPAKYPPITVMECVGQSYKDSYGKATAFKNKDKIVDTPAMPEGLPTTAQPIAV
jgi:isopenicillin N synthase-like dioxygenase